MIHQSEENDRVTKRNNWWIYIDRISEYRIIKNSVLPDYGQIHRRPLSTLDNVKSVFIWTPLNYLSMQYATLFLLVEMSDLLGTYYLHVPQ